MTDNEIIKALEHCTAGGEGCNGCPLNDMPMDCIKSLVGYALGLIKRQQTEIKQLQIALFKQEETIQLISKEKQEYFVKSLAVKSEAITEFAKRLKDMHNHNTTSVVSLVTVFDNINRLVKEMTGL
ncbi:MAG: hypothetical protein IJO91_05625 [Oscillospiraceae bacterium]|nr:hypothetical protein [Oscillospiraceae bacterium]